MPAAAVTSVNFTAGISRSTRLATLGAVIGVTLVSLGAGFRLTNQITPPDTTAMTAAASIERRKARPITASSRWAVSSISAGPLAGWLGALGLGTISFLSSGVSLIIGGSRTRMTRSRMINSTA